MGWARGVVKDEDGNDLEVGYAVDAVCDAEGCDEKIDRGLAYACGGDHGLGDTWCSGYFCPTHLVYVDADERQRCGACAARIDGDSPGAARIVSERRRQIVEEDYDSDHDDEHLPGDLVAAARCYALHAWWLTQGDLCGWSAEMVEDMVLNDDEDGLAVGPHWPWDERDWKPSDDPIRDLERSGALIAAEIDRLLRKESTGA